MAFRTILVANRGEIAVRIMDTAHALGYQTVAMYTEADQQALHVKAADMAVCIGSGPVADSYLNSEKIIAAARKAGADAVHPGYGFLSENGAFAQACEDNGLVFIGPAPSSIELMGNKRLAKLALEKAGVPCIPGYNGANQDLAVLERQASDVGFPLMIKAAAGGGGRGMRLLESPQDLKQQLQSARSESESAFASGELILEKAILNARHVEIQIFADQFGNVLYLGERDCSIQRRHQKVLEESPSPAVGETLRVAMGQAAVEVAKACGYCGAGTVEFLLDEAGNFYFLEMNTRLQVEHPVTEMVTGQDLVAWQLMVAAGEPLPLSQDQVTLSGHAIEVRLYAEDPANGFLPQTGKVLYWQPGLGEGVRVDSGIHEGQDISAYYDPMLAKLIAVGDNREQARRRLLRAVENTQLFGVLHNSEFLEGLLSHPQFVAANVSTDFLDQEFDDHVSLKTLAADSCTCALAALLVYLRGSSSLGSMHAKPQDGAWHNTLTSLVRLDYGDGEFSAEIKSLTTPGVSPTTCRSFEVLVENQVHRISVLEQSQSSIVVLMDSLRRVIPFCFQDQLLYLKVAARTWAFHHRRDSGCRPTAGDTDGSLFAPMDGAVVALNITVGDRVEKGQTLLLLEAMKMEHPLKAPEAGTVERVGVAQGDQVKGRQLLLQLRFE